MTDNSEYAELAHRLNDSSAKICVAVDRFLNLPDDTLFTAGDLKDPFRALKDTIELQQKRINDSTERELIMNDMLTDLVNKHTK